MSFITPGKDPLQATEEATAHYASTLAEAFNLLRTLDLPAFSTFATALHSRESKKMTGRVLTPAHHRELNLLRAQAALASTALDFSKAALDFEVHLRAATTHPSPT